VRTPPADLQSLFQPVLNRPSRVERRLVFADWLDDHDLRYAAAAQRAVARDQIVFWHRHTVTNECGFAGCSHYWKEVGGRDSLAFCDRASAEYDLLRLRLAEDGVALPIPDPIPLEAIPGTSGRILMPMVPRANAASRS
jgi:uncharacterized protein (TIGR02996 family)